MGPILEDVRRNGDQAVKTYTKKFDSVLLDNICKPIEVLLLTLFHSFTLLDLISGCGDS